MARGKDVIVSLAKATTWHTAVDADNANAAILLNSLTGMVPNPEPLLDEALGQTYPQYIDAGNRLVNPVLNGTLRWANTHWNLICAIIGDDALTGGASPYTHTMDVQAEPNLFYTLLANFTTVHEIPSFRPTGFTLSGAAGGHWQFEIRGIGDNVLVSGQTNSSMSSVTARTEALWIPFGNTTVRINDQSGDALASGDAVCPSSMEIVFNRDINAEFCARGGSTNEWLTAMPEEGGFIDCQITMTFNEHSATTYIVDTTGEDFKKMDLTLAGPAISGGNYGSVWSFPALRVISTTIDAANPGRVPETIVLRALQAQSAPNGMSGITNILRHILTDDVSTAYDT